MGNVESVFNVTPKTVGSRFDSLPLSARKTIVWEWAIEGESNLQKSILELAGGLPELPSDLSDETWQQIMKEAAKFYKNYQFDHFMISTDELKETLLTKHDELKGWFDNWEEYRAFYEKNKPLDCKLLQNKATSFFTLLSIKGETDSIITNPDLMHYLINQGCKTVLITEF